LKLIEKVIVIGTENSTEVLVDKMLDMNCGTDPYSIELLKLVSVASQPTRVHLVTRSLIELGLFGGGEFDEIIAAGKGQGLLEVHSEVGPQLRVQYPDQPYDEWLRMAMRPIRTSRGDLIFSVYNNGELRLGAKRARQEPSRRKSDPPVTVRWGKTTRWVFAKGE
jgi:hypothetical protein